MLTWKIVESSKALVIYIYIYSKPNYGGSKDIICVVSESLLIDVDSGTWWVDSASSRYVAKMRDFFIDMKEVKVSDHRVYMGNNTYCDVLGIGTMKIMILGERSLYLSDVLFAPTMRRILISIPCLDEKGFEICFCSGTVSIGKHGRILMWGIKMDGLYCLNDISFAKNNAIVGSFAYFDVSINHSYAYDDACLCMDDPYIWHMRLGHINKNRMKRMINMGLIPNMNIVFTTCEPCISSKMARLPFPKGQRSNELLAIAHSNVCGPLNIKTHRSMLYFVAFIDNFLDMDTYT